MASRLKHKNDFRANAASHHDAPPPYFHRDDDEKRVVEVCHPPPDAPFEPVEKQRHFGILRYIINNRFRKMMLIGMVNGILIVGVLLTVVFVVLKNEKKAESIVETTTDITPTPFITDHSTTPTFSTRSPTTTEYLEPEPCTPMDKTTLMVAYSNDFNPTIIPNLIIPLANDNVIPHYSTFGIIRFDTKIEGDFLYSSSWNEIVSYVNTHLPDPSLVFDNNSIGSDVLIMIERFLNSTSAPVCGSRMIIIVKRYPNEIDYSRLVARMRQRHVYPTILVSNNPSAGEHPEILYDLATKTNGICAFDADTDMIEAMKYLQSVTSPYLLYAVNPQVSRSGNVQLPTLSVKYVGSYGLAMTVQDDGTMSVVQVALLSWKNETNDGTLGKYGTTCIGKCYGNHAGMWMHFDNLRFNPHLVYGYSDDNVRRLQIRVIGSNFINYWPPYDN